MAATSFNMEVYTISSRTARTWLLLDSSKRTDFSGGTDHERADTALGVQEFRASYSVSAPSSQVHSAHVHGFTVSMGLCFPSDRPTPALHLSPRTLVDPLLCYPSEVLQLRFVYIKYGIMSLARRDN